jgi:hypothetical protein
MTQTSKDQNLFDIKQLWRDGSIIGDVEKFQYIGLLLSNGMYEVSTDVINNTNANVASVCVTNSIGVPSSGSAGVFINRPRTINVNNGIKYIYIRVESSGGYLTWNEQSFTPYYIKVLPI